jgi:hypothetical protein
MNHQDLHDALAAIADRSQPTDLYRRSLRRSAQLHRGRRAGASLGAVAAGLLLVLAGWTAARPGPTPAPPVSPPADSLSPSAPATAGPEPTPAAGQVINAAYWFLDATVPVPPWPAGSGCPDGRVKMGPYDYQSREPTVGVMFAAAVSIEGQPAYLVHLICGTPGPGYMIGQLVVYRGRIATGLTPVATVFRTACCIDVGPDDISSVIEARGDGINRIVLTVRQQTQGDATEASELGLLTQQRLYEWNGRTYEQIDGATNFVVGPEGSSVTVQAGPLRVPPPVAGCHTATMDITVRNDGPALAPSLSAVIFFPQGQPPNDCPVPDGQKLRGSEVIVDGLAPGESRTVTATVVFGQRFDGGQPVADDPGNVIQIRTGERRYPQTIRYGIEYR